MDKINYGTSYFGVRDPQHARRDLDRFAEIGLDTVLHTFSERDQKYYRSTIEDIVDLSHKRGFTVYVNPWGGGNVFGGEALTEFPVRHPESRQQLSGGQDLPAACFNAPKFREFMHDWIERAVGTGADVVFWDEPHWYEPVFRGDRFSKEAPSGRCSHCRRRYKRIHSESMPDHETEKTLAFKRQSLLEFLGEMTQAVADAGACNALCVVPYASLAKYANQRTRIASVDHLDVLGVTPFWGLHDADPQEFVGGWAQEITTRADEHDLNSQIWIQGFAPEENEPTREQFLSALRSAESQDPNSIMLWGWDACRVMSSIACESSESIWETYRSHVSP